MRYLLKNAKFFSQGMFHLADVFLSDGKIVSIGDGVSPSNDTIVIDISNMVLFPGFVDVHVHSRFLRKINLGTANSPYVTQEPLLLLQ